MKIKNKKIFIIFAFLILAIVPITVVPKEPDLKKVVFETFQIEDDNPVIAKVDDKNIYQTELDIKKKTSYKSDDEILKDIIIKKLIKLEAKEMNISISDEELETFINSQRDFYLKNTNEKDEGYVLIKGICDKMSITMAEYYDLPEVREAYYSYLLEGKVLNSILLQHKKTLSAEEKSEFIVNFKNELYEKAKDRIEIY